MNDSECFEHYQKNNLIYSILYFLTNQYRLLKHEFLSVE